jgi:hypothetical protein
VAHLSTLSERLGEFMEVAGRTPFAWGRHDCLLHPADWCRVAAGVDPAADFRGRYKTELGARRILKREGGLLELAAGQMRAAGLPAVDLAEIRAGDVGVVRAPRPNGELAHVGAVFTGTLWMALGVRGLVFAGFIPDAAWRPPCPR